MYLRFVTPGDAPVRGIAPGFFRSPRRWDATCDAPDYLRNAIEAEMEWFNQNLAFPKRTWVLAKGVRHYHGVCWFDCRHQETISRAWGQAALIEESGVPVRTLRTSRPGTILYRDDQQVVAKPRADIRYWEH